MIWPEQVLLFAVFLLAYTWIGYPVLLYVRLLLMRLPHGTRTTGKPIHLRVALTAGFAWVPKVRSANWQHR